MSAPDNFVLTDSTYDSFVVGIDGQNEFKVWQGLVGAHYTPYVDANGNLSWTNNGDLPNPPTVNIKGEPGTGLEIKGVVATVGDLPQAADDGDVYLVGTEPPYDGYLFVNNSWTYIGVVGVGQDGRGIASITKTGTSGLVDTYTITYTDGSTPTTFTVTNGAEGAPGQPGQPGRDGTDGVGVPTGGTTGQVLAKASNTNYDTEWIDVEAGGGTVQSVNEVLPDLNGNITITADDIGTDATNISVQDALDGYVHVGTSAPTDPTTKIWLDTDEPGMSAVSSVNGATGTVVLDADDVGAMWQWELLWTNASPTSTFAEQTIQIDLSNYDAVLIQFKEASSQNNYFSTICHFGSNMAFRITPVTSNSRMYAALRTVTVTSSGISFSAGRESTVSSSTSPSNGVNVPYKIYGIKGVVTS